MLSCPGQTPALPWGSLRASGAPGVKHPAGDRSKHRHPERGRSRTGRKSLQGYGVKQAWGFLGHLNTTDLFFFFCFQQWPKKRHLGFVTATEINNGWSVHFTFPL